MEIVRHQGIEKDFKSLKKFPAPRESLEAWERLFKVKGLKETPGVEPPYPGFGVRRIHKARIVPLGENVGKSHGYRVIFEILEENLCKVLVFSRHGVYSSEQELINLIKERLE